MIVENACDEKSNHRKGGNVRGKARRGSYPVSGVPIMKVA